MTRAVVTGGVVPDWTMSDRLRKAREFAGLSQGELAEAVDLSPRAVGNYEAGRRVPRRPAILAWSAATGVSMFWLENGENPPSGDDGGPVSVRPKGFEPLTFCLVPLIDSTSTFEDTAAAAVSSYAAAS